MWAVGMREMDGLGGPREHSSASPASQPCICSSQRPSYRFQSCELVTMTHVTLLGAMTLFCIYA